MAAPVVASKQNTAFASGSSTTITKPTGLAEDDLLVAFICQFIDNETLSTPSGWTARYNDSTGNGSVAIFTKVATSADVAASNFTFSASSTTIVGGALFRVTGVANGSEIAETSVVRNATPGSTLSETLSATPGTEESLVFGMVVSLGSSLSAVVTTNGYTSTPTLSFTEEYDFGYRDGLSDGGSLAIVSATNDDTEITALGAELTETPDDAYVGVIVINAPLDANTTLGFVTSTQSVFAPSGIAGANTTLPLASSGQSVFPPTGKGTSPTQWTNEAEGSTTWTNEASL